MGSNASMALPGARRLACLVLCVGVSACAKTTPKTIAAPPGPTPTERLAEADRLVRAGCLDCLLDAYHRYDALRAIPTAATPATLGAIRAAGLIALASASLGWWTRATSRRPRHWRPARPICRRGCPVPRHRQSARRRDRRHQPAGDHRPRSRAHANAADQRRGVHEVAAGFLGGGRTVRLHVARVQVRIDGCARMATPDIFAAVSTFRDTPLIAFEQATCRTIDTARISALAAAEPRFVETSYLLGLREVARRKLDEADGEFAKAYAWRPRWPSLTLSMGNVAMTAEEFERAERLYGETLAAIRALPTRGSAGSRRYVSRQGGRGDRGHRRDARRPLAPRRRALLARAQRIADRALRRGVDRCRGGSEAVNQLRRAEARRHHRLPSARARRVARSIPAVARAQQQRLRSRVLSRRRAGGAADVGSHRRGFARSGRVPAERGRRGGARHRDDSRVGRSRRNARPNRLPAANSSSPTANA